MRDKALVINYENGIATVKPLLSDTCINCNSSTCSHKSSVFVATNPKQLPVKPGSLVKIGASVKSQIVQTIFSVGFPLITALIGYSISTPLAKVLNRIPTESTKVAGLFIGLLIAMAIVFFVSQTKGTTLTKPQITSVEDTSSTMNQTLSKDKAGQNTPCPL